MTERKIYRVTVRHNVVFGIQRLAESGGIEVPETKLEVGTQLARNHQANGCIDGDYYFDDVDTARYFAILSLDSVKKLIEKTIETLEADKLGPDADWRNAHIAPANEAGMRLR